MPNIKKSTRTPSRGKVKAIGLGVFSDAELTQPIIEIDWGMLAPDESKTLKVYLLSTGKSNIDVTLTMTTEKWAPIEAAGFIGLAWDKEGHVLSPEESVEATFILTVSPDIQDITSFSKEIVMTASG